MRKIVLLSFFAALVIVFLYRLTGVLAHGIAPTHNRRPTRAVQVRGRAISLWGSAVRTPFPRSV